MTRIPNKSLGELYNRYSIDNKEDTLTLPEFKKASKLVFQDIVDSLFRGEVVKLPHGMGKMFLQPYKLKGKKLDYGMTKKYGKKIFYTNLHSDGNAYKLKWVKSSSLFKNKDMFSFKLNRHHSRHLAKLIKQEKIKIFKRYGEL